VGIKDILGKTERSKFIKSLILAALFEPVLYMLFETLGIAAVSGITAAVILSLGPITSLICEAILLKEHASKLQIAFLIIGIIGVIYIAVCTGSTEGSSSVLGILFIICAVLCGSLFATFSRKSSRHFSCFEVSYFSCLFGTVAFNSVNVIRHLVNGDILNYFDPYFNRENMIGFLFLAIASTILATIMGNFSLGRLQVSTTAAFGGISTVVTILIDVIFNDEPLYYFHYIGISMILIRMIGVSVISIRREKKSNLLSKHALNF
jgi:drug/metabolite transporter (DMT)-like permease